MSRSCIALLCLACLVPCTALASVLVSIPLDQQINIGLGDAIADYTSYVSDPAGGFLRKSLTVGAGAGEYYWGPSVDLVKAGYGPSVDMSAAGTTVEYTARYFQGDGNTNPYADAPIFVQLHDINGRSRGLGLSYGPQPDPTYPSWIACTDDLVNAEWPNDASFDLTQVVTISFFGTDWAGTGNDYVDIKNLRIVDNSVHNTIPISSAKTFEDDSPVEVEGVVTASLESEDVFYVQETNRSCGIQVRCTDTLPGAGANVYVSGIVRTDGETGEMYIQCSDWSPNGTGAAKPLLMNTKSVGGGQFARQQGPSGGSGLNNVGLLMKICGKVTDVAEDRSYAYVTDGGVDVFVDLTAMPFWQRPSVSVDEKVTVTGVCGLYKGTDDESYPMIRISSGSGFVNLDSDGNEPKTIRVLVVNFDPYCPGYGNVRTHQVFGWNDAHDLADGYIDDLFNCSGGWCQYQIVDWFDADYHPYFEDNFQFDPDDYVYAWTHQVGLHEGTADYVRLVTDASCPHNQPSTIAERIAADEIDEVFFFGAPGGFAGWEAAMAGPSPFFINGGTYTVPTAGRNFAMMGFNYERDVDCMLEDFCHRTECVMSRVYSPPEWWFPTWPVQNNWDRFRMFDIIEPGEAACGICHYAPSSESDYDWGNTRYVWSTCDDWLYNWPNLLGSITKRWVNCSEWGYGDMRLHHIWWLEHLPKVAGINPDGKQNNWWKYTCDFNSYPESR